MKLRTRIASFYSILLVGGVLLVSAISSWQITNYLDDANVRALGDHTDLFARLIESGTLTVLPDGSSDETLRNAARALRIRMTIIDRNGIVVFDSTVPRDSLGHVENHATRPEIVAARAGGIGLAHRMSATTGEEYLYSARQLHTKDEAPLSNGYIRAAMGMGEIQAVTSRVRMTIWVIGVASVIFIVILTLQVSRRITKPILEIAITAQAIRDGDLHQRIIVTSNDEIASLATSINQMAERLASDIDRLTKLEHVRSQFLGNVSHELRTPIFSIQGFIETLLDGAMDDPTVNRSFLEKAHKHATRLNSLLNDLIEISRIESGEMKMSFRFFALQEFLEGCAEEFATEAQAREISFSLFSSLPADYQVQGDRDRVRQVLTNLVDNAVKYTDPGGSIVLRTVQEKGFCRIEVEDTGCGIAPEHHARIFERFYRADKDRSRDVGGTGLGLAIVKHIVEAHGGSIGLKSIPGKGSAFFFTLKT
jgi:two-component system phosphate regulon sensor histidine kinase PhoR